MKNFLYFILICFLLFLIPSGVLAQTVNSSASSSQATSSAKPNMNLSKAVTSLMSLLKAALTRADNISQRMSSRLTKLNSSDPQQVTISNKIEMLKTSFTKLNHESQSFTTSSFSKQDYLLFRTQLIDFTKNLGDVYKQEFDLLASIKKVASVTTIPTATASSNTVSGQ
ncbi:hypothetical protein HY029_05810 [Candidatus Gottesmanbacteria bacterium]|nr:hypothetical protein [Candidatus Gottesmanbacteria bacterium]